MGEFDEIKETYNRIAHDYQRKRANPDSATWNDVLEVPAVDSIVKPLVSNKRTLDLGCGTGIVTSKIVNWGGTTVGIDISEKMIQLARTNNPDIEFIVGGSHDLAFGVDSFDVVVSSLVMHYLKNLRPTFNEVARVLTADGHFVFTMHHPMQESFSADKAREGGKPVMDPYFHSDRYYWRMCGTKIPSFHHTFQDIIGSLKSAGFVLIDLIECRPDPEMAESFEDYEFTSQYPTFCLFHTRLD